MVNNWSIKHSKHTNYTKVHNAVAWYIFCTKQINYKLTKTQLRKIQICKHTHAKNARQEGNCNQELDKTPWTLFWSAAELGAGILSLDLEQYDEFVVWWSHLVINSRKLSISERRWQNTLILEKIGMLSWTETALIINDGGSHCTESMSQTASTWKDKHGTLPRSVVWNSFVNFDFCLRNWNIW